jgi:tetratricopeptide (TPR) repeat protein
MSEEHPTKPPAAWLDHLHQAGHWPRLIEVASQSLQYDPNDSDVHRHLAWAYARTDAPARMKQHVDFLLRAEPDEIRNHHLAAVYYLDNAQHKRAKPHVDFLLLRDPRSPTNHYLACIHALRCGKMREARRHIGEARSLAPNWPEALRLEIEIDGASQQRASEAWTRIRRLEEGLALDPRNADMIASIGSILLHELEQPREAETHFREALAIDPTDKEFQRKLLDALRARSILYRTLSLPITAVRKIRGWSPNALRLVFLLIAFKAVLAFCAWLIVTGFLFAPAAKVYEWFVLAEITHIRGFPRLLTPLRRTLRWPLWLRLALALSIIVGGWVLLFSKVFAVPPATSLQIMGVLFGLHFAIVALLIGLRKLRARFGLWRNRRSLRGSGKSPASAPH